MADAEIEAKPVDQDELVADIDRTRAELARTIDAIADRVSPKKNVDRVMTEVRQRASSREMVVGVGELLAHISACMTLEPGDAIFTGTPAGVGPLRDGDVVEVEKIGRAHV